MAPDINMERMVKVLSVAYKKM